jgi:hypothetical protein
MCTPFSPNRIRIPTQGYPWKLLWAVFWDSQSSCQCLHRSYSKHFHFTVKEPILDNSNEQRGNNWKPQCKHSPIRHSSLCHTSSFPLGHTQDSHNNVMLLYIASCAWQAPSTSPLHTWHWQLHWTCECNPLCFSLRWFNPTFMKSISMWYIQQ